METILSLLALAAALAYAVVFGVAIARGKRWALDIARAMAAVEPRWMELDQIHRGDDGGPEPDPAEAAEAQTPPDRLAA